MCDIVDCDRRSTFWVQAIPTTHNRLVCTRHLARTVHEIDTASMVAIDPNYDGAYRRDGVLRNGKLVPRNARGSESSNYARVTVKPIGLGIADCTE